MKKHFTHFLILQLLFTLLSIPLIGQSIRVNSSYTKEQLIKDIFVGSSCIEIMDASINISGWNFNNGDKSYGYFDKGTSNFPLDRGILLSTGELNDAPGPNNGINSKDASNWEGDNDLERALNIRNTTNATILEFDFISPQSNQISFDYLFASEQYLRPNDLGNCGYTDGFAFLIKKAGSTETYKNLAVLPNTTTPVSVNTVYGNGGKCSPVNPQYFGQFNATNSPISFNGQTKTFTASTTIIPGEKYHIKLVIADQGNGFYDSGVFLKAGSFVGTKSLGSDLYLCPGDKKIIDAKTANATYKWYKNGNEIIGETNQTITVNTIGFYEVEITQTNGCVLKAYQNIVEQPQPIINNQIPEFCDDDLDGNISIDLSLYIDRILTNFEEDLFDVKFFETQQEAMSNLTNGINRLNLTNTVNSKTIYFRIQPGDCAPIIAPIIFKSNQLSSSVALQKELCDTNIDNQETVILSDYLSEIATNIEGTPSYYSSESDAKNQLNSINVTQIINSDKTFYIRYKQVGYCANISSIDFKFKQPKKSTTLNDVTICKNATTTLDAGSGFDSYLWSNGATTSSISTIPVGNYHVRLEYNGCFYTQEVKVLAATDPVIQTIDIQGSTVTVIVLGDHPPYQYSLDNGPFQTSNIFTNVTLGNHTVSVKSSLNCEAVKRDFSLIQLINFLSPNGDGKNDRLDYSQLKSKINPKFLIYDRNGLLVFEGSQANNFTWDGKKNGFIVPSTSYWYTIEWSETTLGEIKRFTNWLLVKNPK